MRILSMFAWSSTSSPVISGAIISFTFCTAFSTPLPLYLFSPSLSSSASCLPVDAPDGTCALPKAPDSVIQSTSIVGFPLESRISLATISSIRLIPPPFLLYLYPLPDPSIVYYKINTSFEITSIYVYFFIFYPGVNNFIH